MLNLDNETIYLEQRDKMTREELEEVFASKAVAGNPDIVNNVMVFEKLCLALNGVIPSFEHVEEPSLTMVCGAIKKMRQIGVDTTILSEQVKKYIACVAFHDGFVVLPRIIHFAQSFLDKLTSDNGKTLFAGITPEMLTKGEISDSDSPIDMHRAKMMIIEAFLDDID